jgi:Leucine-rich repeat (LRR) protein
VLMHTAKQSLTSSCLLALRSLPFVSSKKLFQLERMYLDGLSLNSIDDSFDLFSKSLTHLYLQRNLLTHTHGFSCLKQLQFLMLASNHIRVVEGLEGLDKLVFLDLSHNLIEMLDTGSTDDDSVCQLPEALVVLNFAGNPFTEDEDYVEHIVTVSPYLKVTAGTDWR